MSNVYDIISDFKNLNILVIGDVMLDIYSYGISNRLSPEAPIPVIKTIKKNMFCGGAGNVASNLTSLQVNTFLLSVSGNDGQYNQLNDLLIENKIKTQIIKDQRTTTVKERFIANNQQQLLRVDTEDCNKITNEIETNLINNLHNIVENNNIDGIIISDYNKGLLSNEFVQKIIDYANQHNIITAIDPKPDNLNNIKNCSVIKMNRIEAFQLVGLLCDGYSLYPNYMKEQLLRDVAKKAYDIYNPKYLIISLSGDGVAVYFNNELKIIPTYTQEVFDVSGAGDTLLATITSALVTKRCDIIDCVKLGNIASGIVVEKRGTSIVTADQLIEKLNKTQFTF